MDVTPLVQEGAQIVQSYAGGRFRVSGVVYESAVIVSEGATVVWDVSGFDGLCLEDFQPVIDRGDAMDVVLLGCGARMRFLPPDLKKALRAAGLHVETMDTGSSCRRYNVLMAEGRRVVCALLAV